MSQEETVNELRKKLNSLQEEFDQYREKFSIFSDVVPYIEDTTKQKIHIQSLNLTYVVNLNKVNILEKLHKRVAQDLHKPQEDIRLIEANTSKDLLKDEDLRRSNKVGDSLIIEAVLEGGKDLDSHCHHDHHDDYSDDDFTDDENFYTSCSCAHTS